jgi:membrane protein implicated in regulation of membrane protease activity
VKTRTAGEWAGLAAYFVLAGAAIAFGVLILGSAVGLPPVALAIVVVAALALIAVPLSRFEPRATSEPTSEGEDRHE